MDSSPVSVALLAACCGAVGYLTHNNPRMGVVVKDAGGVGSLSACVRAASGCIAAQALGGTSGVGPQWRTLQIQAEFALGAVLGTV